MFDKSEARVKFFFGKFKFLFGSELQPVLVEIDEVEVSSVVEVHDHEHELVADRNQDYYEGWIDHDDVDTRKTKQSCYCV